FQRAVEDRATVPLYYDARGDKLGIGTDDLNQRIADKLDELEIENIDVAERLERELKRDYHIITANQRLDQLATDLVDHYATSWETGKAMLICLDKITCVRMYDSIQQKWQQQIQQLQANLANIADQQEEIYLRRQLKWMEETQTAVVFSEEQGEVDKFRQWGLDVTFHRELIKKGIQLPESMRQREKFRHLQRMELDQAFKEPEHPFRIAIVCAMWLTGFDVPCLSNLYLDKPLKAHTLMQAIARANRVFEGKNNGLIVDYCGILKQLRQALATFAGTSGIGDDDEVDPTRPTEELIADLAESILMVRQFLDQNQASLDDIIQKTGFARNAAIMAAKEAANQNDESRKRFEILSREVFKKFKACLNVKEIRQYRPDRNAIDIVYKSLQQDREQVDISGIMRQLHQIVDDAVQTNTDMVKEPSAPYDISQIYLTTYQIAL
ncbi:MAG: type I restriction endonuclease subunit R, partial [Candidatus Poribacteria bacterium]|nr:type I restriction endonuclease subunit R [Candidatus Poribacteria bacterium]